LVFCRVSSFHVSSTCHLVQPTLDDKASFAIVLGNLCLIDTARGIFFPTLRAHVSQLGGDKIAQGYCVGASSFGRHSCHLSLGGCP
ncbi:unnamed protein product, partial [Ectocarpus sp. 12 AP-2014]